MRAVASLAWQALPAWIWPASHLHDRPARMRASLATGLMSWSFLAGLGLVFAQLTQLQGYRPAAHPLIGWCYAVFDGALAVSVLVAGLGGLPLWLLMLRRARRDRSAPDLAFLLAPVVVPAVYLAAVRVTVRVVGGPGGVSPWWFLAVTMAGFGAAGLCAAGPALALRLLSPAGRPCAWPRGRAASRPRPCWRPAPPSSSRWQACACGPPASPATTTPPCPGSSWPW